MLTKGVMRGVVGCIGRGRVAIGSCYREREKWNGRKRREREQGGGGSGKEEGGGGREEEGREEGRIKATGNELTQAKTKTLER